MKTSELIGPALDWAVAKCEGRVLREPVNATYEDVAGIKTPFYLREVAATYHNETCVAAVVKDIKVIRCGVDLSIGASAPSISFVASDGVICRGSVEMFFLSNEEAEMEAQRYLHGDTEGFSPSTNWAQGGPIIEREEIALAPGYNWEATKEIEYRGEADYCVQHGPTPLIAAMRSYVCGNLGDEIEIPEELK